MEIPAATTQIEDPRESMDGSDDKPLPPTPTIPSSVYRLFTEDVPIAPQFVTRRDVSLPVVLQEPAKMRSSTSKLPDPSPRRPQIARGALSHAALESAANNERAEESNFGEWKAPKYHEPDEDTELSLRSPVALKGSTKSEEVSAQQHEAEVLAGQYQSLLTSRTSQLPGSNREPYGADFNHSPKEMSSRITDVIDQPTVPAPLRVSIGAESQPSRKFSSSSASEIASFDKEIRKSLRSYARKKLHLPKTSLENQRQESYASWGTFESEKQNQNDLELTTPQRASIQKGIFDLYDAPQNTKSKLEFSNPRNKIFSKEHRNPAVPITPYQKFGKKAWETAKSPRLGSKSTRARRNSRSTDEEMEQLSTEKRKMTRQASTSLSDQESRKEGSVGKKLAQAVGLDTGRQKKTRSEKRRDEMKKKIVIVKAGS